MAPSEQSAHPKMLLKSPSKPSLAGLSRAKMSKAQLAKGEDFKRNPDSHEAQPARVGGRKGSTEKNGSCGGTTTTGTTAMMGRAKSRVQLNPESIKVGQLDMLEIMMVTLTLIIFYWLMLLIHCRCWQIQQHHMHLVWYQEVGSDR